MQAIGRDGMVAKNQSECRLASSAAERDIRSVIDGLPFYVMLVDEDHCIVLANKALEKAIGKKAEDIKGGYCPSLVHGTDGPFPGCPLEEAVSRRGSVTRETYDARTQRWMLAAIYPTALETVAGKKVYYHTALDITEQKTTSEALGLSLERYRLIVENSNDGICITDLRGNILGANENMCRMTGWSPDQIVAQNISDISRMDDPDVFVASMREMTGGTKTVFEGQLVCKDGHVMPVEVSAAVISAEGQGLAHAFIRDISERKTSENALRQAEAKFRSFADHSHDWEYWVNDERTEIVYMSPSCERITGYKPKDFAADVDLLSKIVYPEDRAKYEEHVNASLGHESDGEADFRVIRRDGTLRWLAHTCHGVVDSSGVSRGRRVSNRDITARKELEEAAALRELQLRQIIDLVPHMIYVNDWEGRFILANKATAVAYSTTPEKLLRKKCADVHLEKNELEKIIEEDREVMTEGCAKEIPEFIFTDASGRQKIMQKAKVPFKYLGPEGEQTYAVLGVSVDITDLKRAEKKAAKNLERLTEAFHGMITALAATVETRDPYTARHQSRVQQLATAIAGELKLTDDQIDSLSMAAMVHDIGKIYVPAEILNKPGRLTDIEFTLIKSHVDAGYRILKDIKFRDPVADIVRQHHERLDGSGYPQGLRADQILKEAKIIAVADVVEAMSSDRPYRPALGVEATLDEIEKNSGILYDPDFVAICLKLFRENKFEFK